MGYLKGGDHFNTGRGLSELCDWLTKVLEQGFIGIEVGGVEDGSYILDGSLQCCDSWML